MKRIQLSEELALPADAVTQTFAFLARRGAGKTYGASKLCEGMVGLGAQVVVVDPVGVWWGLRLAADGKGKGLSIPVFGGLHGDIPLEPGSGPLVADLVVDRELSVVLDVSMFRKGDRKRFATEFAEQLYHRKKAKRGPVHLFIEEAQVFVPQRAMGDEARMLGAFEDLVKLGRNFGIGVTLISQRPQSVNKDALNQTECLVVLQTNGSQERKALADWIVEAGLDVEGLVDTLPSLKKGEAWVWSPSWLGITKRIHIAKKDTFNASATPEVGTKAREPRELEPVDLEAVREAMKGVVERAAAEDPRALKKQVAELRAQLAKAGAARVEEKRVEVSVLKADHVARLEKAVDRFADALEQVRPIATELTGLLHVARAPVRLPTVTVHAEPRAARVARAVGADVPPSQLPKGARDMLTALASTLLPSLTRNQVAMLAGLKVTGGTFQKYLSTLKTGGYLEDRGGALTITQAGEHAIGGKPPAPATHAEVVALWNGKLPAGARDMLAALIQTWPEGTSREQLADEVSMEVKGGTFQKYLSILRTNGLIEIRDGVLVASETLFPGGGR